MIIELTSPVGTRFHLVPIIPTGSTCHTSGRTAKDRTNEVEPQPGTVVYNTGSAKLAAGAYVWTPVAGSITDNKGITALTGDVTAPSTTDGSAVATLTNTSVAAGTYGEVGVNRALTAGDTFVVPKITLDEKGRATSAESVTLSIRGVAWLGAFDITADSAIAPGASGSVSASCPPGSLTLDVRAATPNLHFYYRSDVGFMLQNDESFQIEATWVVGHTHCFQL